MKRNFVAELDFPLVFEHYARRADISAKLRFLLASHSVDEYVDLALGIDDPYGNYSAADHALGRRILEQRSKNSIFALGCALSTAARAQDVQRIIYQAGIPYLKIGVGSEMAMLLQPEVHWVANTRSIWSHLLLKHRSVALANEELKLYRDGSEESEMAYKMWCSVHLDMKKNFDNLAAEGDKVAAERGGETGEIKYLWADAIANALYEKLVG